MVSIGVNEWTVTGMNEYINRESIYKTLLMENPFGWNNDDLAELFRQAKPADVAPVRHGRWEEMHYEGGILDGTNFDRCSVCGYERVFDDPAFKTGFRYCPSCGAKMDGERRDSE